MDDSALSLLANEQARIALWRPFGELLFDAFLIVDSSRIVLYANKPACLLFERTEEHLIGARVEELMPEQFRAGHPALVEKYLELKQARNMGPDREVQILRPSGKSLRVYIGLKSIVLDDSQVLVGVTIRTTP